MSGFASFRAFNEWLCVFLASRVQSALATMSKYFVWSPILYRSAILSIMKLMSGFFLYLCDFRLNNLGKDSNAVEPLDLPFNISLFRDIWTDFLTISET